MESSKPVDHVRLNHFICEILLIYTGTVFNAVHRTLNAKLTDLSDKIQRAIDDVDKGARIDRDERSDRHMEILNGNLSLALGRL